MKFQGGESAVQRLMQAYGFTMKKQLGDHLGAGTGTISTWVKRGYFPGEAIVRCALETGVSLEWLATGNGYTNGHLKDNSLETVSLSFFLLKNGSLSSQGCCYLDSKILPKDVGSLEYLKTFGKDYLIDVDRDVITDGLWLLSFDDVYNIYECHRLPAGRLKINNGDATFECSVSDVKLYGKIVSIIERCE
ncbi:phage repressor protein CI [Hafnia paralvei]|uniref:phage repressor protein CI n=1 Tax=Hafnia paralvei TaxID=546367 RepID=UPI003CF8C4B5